MIPETSITPANFRSVAAISSLVRSSAAADLSAHAPAGLVSQGDPRMPLDRQAKRILGMLAAGGMPPAQCRFHPPQAARGDAASGAGFRRTRRRDRRSRESRSTQPGGPLAVRVYTPGSLESPCSNARRSSISTAAPGVFCSIDTHEGLCRMLANASGCRVYSVDYRLAPEHPFPAALEDALFRDPMALSNMRAKYASIRSALAVGGDSVRRYAGGGRVPARQSRPPGRRSRCRCSLPGHRPEPPRPLPGRLTDKAISSTA